MEKNIINNENTIIFTIGRMNPPTSGHMLLIKQMIQKAIELNLTQINIILSATVDKKKNPFSCSQKRFFLSNSSVMPSMIQMLKQQMIDKDAINSEKINQIEVKIVCMDDATDPKYGKHPIIKSVNYILYDLYGYPRDGLQMILLIGEDRKSDYDWLKKTLENREDLPSVNLQIVGLERPEGAMSATKMRNLALNNHWDDFRVNMQSMGISDETIREIYDGIRNNMISDKSNTKRALSTSMGPSSKKARNGGYKKKKTKERKMIKKLKQKRTRKSKKEIK
jgi:nicotinic acid mononucleotide adenylyltransferase